MKPLHVLLVLALAASDGRAAAGGEGDVLRAMDSARRLAETQRWSLACRELDRLFAEHERESALVPHLSEAVDLYRRCRFFAEHDRKRDDELVSGELETWDPRSGRVSIRYRALGSDFSSDGHGARLHPLEFTGPYRLEARGRMGAAPTSTEVAPELPQLLVLVRGSESHQIAFGLPPFEVDGASRWIPPRIFRHDGGPPELVAEAPATSLAFRERYVVEVSVGSDTIRVRANGKTLFEVPKPHDLYGRVAVLDLPGLEELSLSGTASPTWLSSLRDAERDTAWREFLAAWDDAAELPAWVARALGSSASPSAAGTGFRFPLEEDQLAAFRSLLEHLSAGRVELGLAELDRLDEEDLAPQLQDFYRALFELQRERPEDARIAIEAALRTAPDFVEARVIRGRVLGELGDEEAALDALREVVAEAPGLALGQAELARWCLRSGRPDEAREVVAAALRAGVPHESLRETESLLTRALTGPAWERVFEYRSRHYVVRSDRSRQLCFDAARELETALRFYQFRLGRLRSRDAPGTTYPVYLFSGRAGYEGYAGDLFGAAPESTAGLYSPMLKQLLVRNPPEVEDLFRTLRHEGLHQFLDASVGTLPPWFNEGMAEYFEDTELVRGVPTDGRPNGRHIALLLDPGHRWIPFEELLDMTPGEFYREPSAKYAQSWALVHYLQNSGIANARLFQRLLDDLARGVEPRAFRGALLAVDDLEGLVREHLRGLSRDF